MNWPSLLPSSMMAFRSTPCTESTGFSPYHLLFGKEIHLPIDISLVPKPTLGQNVQQYFEQLISRLKVVKEIAKSNLEKAQAKAKHAYDIRAEQPKFQVDDLVILKQDKILKVFLLNSQISGPDLPVSWIPTQFHLQAEKS